MACLAVPHFPRYLINSTIFGGKKLLNMKCVLWFSPQRLSVTGLIPVTIQRDFIINVHTSSRKMPVILVRLQSKFNFMDKFSKNIKYQISFKSISSSNNQHNAQICTTALFYMLAPTCFGSSVPSSGSLYIRLSYMKIQNDMVVAYII
jgi:hypothetical protein